MKFLAIFNLIVFGVQLCALGECYPEKEFVVYQNGGGIYNRIHPSGDYVLYTSNRGTGVSIADLTQKNSEGKIVVKEIRTPMTGETYPVEGRWDLLAAPYAPGGMAYYQLSDILNVDAPQNALPIFKDKKHDQFYHSSAELPGGKSEKYEFRTTLWEGQWTQDYQVTTDEAGKRKVEKKGQRYKVCENIFNPKTAGLSSAERIALQEEKAKIEREYLTSALTERDRMDMRHQEISRLLNPTSANSLSQPTLSKDGTMIAGIPVGKDTTHIYKIKENGDCELVKDIGIRTSKISFSYPEGRKLPLITFMNDNFAPQASRGAYVYDLNTDLSFKVSGETDADGYPGFTKDGRVVYSGSSKDSNEKRITGYFRVDAIKITSNGSKCASVTSSKSQSKKTYEPRQNQGEGANQN